MGPHFKGFCCIRCGMHRTNDAQNMEVERAFDGKGGAVIGVRWLLNFNSRRGKAASSLVVF